MAIEILQVDGQNRPTCVCDVCHEPVSVKDGHVRWATRAPAWKNEQPLEVVHRACEAATGGRRGSSAEKSGGMSLWMPLDAFLMFLCNNSDFDTKAQQAAAPRIATFASIG